VPLHPGPLGSRVRVDDPDFPAEGPEGEQGTVAREGERLRAQLARLRPDAEDFLSSTRRARGK
jgi:hypothetical protein